MELVFIHGWGFDQRFWDPLCALLPQFAQRRVDLGFYGNPSAPADFGDDAILIGHSLGFVHGMAQKKTWRGWIAINSFPRFVSVDGKSGCVSEAQLREINFGLTFAPAMALQRFYGLIGAKQPEGSPDIGRLKAGLEELRTGDVSPLLETLDVPGLVLAARNDPLVPVAASEALGGMARSNIIWHETGGHILPVADPAWCAEAIQGFVKNFSE